MLTNLKQMMSIILIKRICQLTIEITGPEDSFKMINQIKSIFNKGEIMERLETGD